MKRRTKKYIYRWVILAIASGIILFLATDKWLESKELTSNYNLFSLVPANCEAILETSNITSVCREIDKSEYKNEYKNLKVSELFSYISSDLNRITGDHAHGISAKMSHLVVSFHTPGDIDDQVIYFRLGKNDRDFMEGILTKNNHTSFPPKKIAYRDENITVYPLNDEKFLAVFCKDRFAAISFHEKLIENVIDTYKDRRLSVENNPEFRQLTHREKLEGNLTLYFKSNNIYSYLSSNYSFKKYPVQSSEKWNVMDLKFTPRDIYLTGFNKENLSSSSSSMQPSGATSGNAEPSNLVVPHTLPEGLCTYSQFDVSRFPSIYRMMTHNPREALPATPADKNMLEWLLTHTKEVNLIQFAPVASDSLHTVMVLPVTCQDAVPIGMNTGKGGLSSVRDCDLLQPFFPAGNPEILFLRKKDVVIASDKLESIELYTRETVQPQENAESRLLRSQIGELSDKSSLTYASNLEMAAKKLATNPVLIPPFIFKYSEFFRHFNFAIQFVDVQGLLSTNISFKYKG